MNQTIIRNQIQQLQVEKQALALPDLAALEAAITFHGARTSSIDQATANHHQRAMQDAMTAKDQAEASWKRAQEINAEIATLQGQLAMAESEEKAHKVNAANQRMANAHDEFHLAALQVIRAYRRCMNIGRQNASIPGASTKLPKDFDFTHLRSPYGSQAFTIAAQMAFGPLRIEMDDNEKEAA